MIDMQKLGTEWGYRPKAAPGATGPAARTGGLAPSQATYGQAFPAPQASVTKPEASGAPTAGTPTVQAYQPQTQPQADWGAAGGDPYGGELWTPQEWGEVGDYARAGMQSPYEQSEGLTKGMSGLDSMMGAGGWGTGIDEYRAASDPLFELQQKRIADQVRQRSLLGGFSDSTMETDRMGQRLSENMMNREFDFANRALSLEEARKQRMMQGLGMYGQFGGQQAGERDAWARRGMGYAGMLGETGDKYWRAPMDFADASGRQAQGWAGTEMSDSERMYNDYFNVQGKDQQYTPGFGTRAANLLGQGAVAAAGGLFDRPEPTSSLGFTQAPRGGMAADMGYNNIYDSTPAWDPNADWMYR